MSETIKSFHINYRNLENNALVKQLKLIINEITLNKKCSSLAEELIISWEREGVWRHLLADFDSKDQNSSLCFYALILLLNGTKGSSSTCVAVTEKTDLVWQLLGLLTEPDKEVADNEELSNFTVAYTIVSNLLEEGFLDGFVSGIDFLKESDAHKANFLLDIIEFKFENDNSKDHVLSLANAILSRIVHTLEYRSLKHLKETQQYLLPSFTKALAVHEKAKYAQSSGFDKKTESLVTHFASLRWLDVNVPRIQPTKSIQVPPIYQLWHGVKRDVLRNITILLENNRQAQDLISEKYPEHVALVLSHSQYDDLNPYVREYAILALRYLTQNHARIQEQISKMELLSVSAETALEIKKITGKTISTQNQKLLLD